MADEFNVTNGVDETPDFDLPDTGQPESAKAEPAEKTITQELEAEFDKLGTGDADAKDAAQWARELRALSDSTLRGYGIDPSQRAAANISRREVARRLFRADEMLRSDPATGLPSLAAVYADQLPPEVRARVAGGIIQKLGFSTPNAIAEQDRARLQQYDLAAQERQAAEAAALPRIRAEYEAFRAAHADFESLRVTMAGLIHSGAARGLQDSYELARRAHGIEDAAARARDEERRASVAKARAAGTPTTKSYPGKYIERPGPDKSTTALLESAWDELGMGGPT